MKKHLLFSLLFLFFQNCREEYPVKIPVNPGNKTIKNRKKRSSLDIDLKRTETILSKIWSQANPDISTADLYKGSYDLIFKANYITNEDRWNIFLKWCEEGYIYTLVNKHNHSDSVHALVDKEGSVLVYQEGDVLLKRSLSNANDYTYIPIDQINFIYEQLNESHLRIILYNGNNELKRASFFQAPQSIEELQGSWSPVYENGKKQDFVFHSKTWMRNKNIGHFNNKDESIELRFYDKKTFSATCLGDIGGYYNEGYLYHCFALGYQLNLFHNVINVGNFPIIILDYDKDAKRMKTLYFTTYKFPGSIFGEYTEYFLKTYWRKT